MGLSTRIGLVGVAAICVVSGIGGIGLRIVLGVGLGKLWRFRDE